MSHGTMKVLTLAGALALCIASSVANADGRLVGEGIKLRPIESTRPEEKFQTMIIYRGLQKLGYEIVEPQQVDYQTIYDALGSGRADFTVVHWDQLHSTLFKKAGGKAVITKVGRYVTGARQGYLVDMASYKAGITNLGHLRKPDVAKRFDVDNDGKADLAGCLPGWPCADVIDHHLKVYKLGDTVTHNQGAYETVMSETIARHRDGQPVVYYARTPHWVSGVLVPGKDVQWLAVPHTALPDGRKGNTKHKGKNLGFARNRIQVIARKEFLKANPAVNKLFQLAKLKIKDIAAQNKKMRDGENTPEDLERHVDEWIKANERTFHRWIVKSFKAAR